MPRRLPLPIAPWMHPCRRVSPRATLLSTRVWPRLETEQTAAITRPFIGFCFCQVEILNGAVEESLEHRMSLERTRKVASGTVFPHSRGIAHRNPRPCKAWFAADTTASNRAQTRR